MCLCSFVFVFFCNMCALFNLCDCVSLFVFVCAICECESVFECMNVCVQLWTCVCLC